jgi:broad specificity phosphatase PhoE
VRLILVRHGQSEGNASGVMQGRLDFGLSLLGREQAKATAVCLATVRIDRILTSPLARAAETARSIAEPHGIAVEPEPGLLEYDPGPVSGLTGAQIRQIHPEIMASYARGERPKFPGEEGREVFSGRIAAVLESLQGTEKTIVAVAHGGVISAVCSIVLGIEHHRPGAFQVANCSLTELGTDRAGRLVLHGHNDTCHLDGIVTVNDRG